MPIQKLNRCQVVTCNKKLTLSDTISGKCRCDLIYCSLHRLPSQHMCTYVFVMDTKDFIEKNKCVSDKVIKI